MENYYKNSTDKELSIILGGAKREKQIFKLMNRMKSIFTRNLLSSHIIGVLMLAMCFTAVGQPIVHIFNHTGSAQTFIIPPGIFSVSVECYGGSGGVGGSANNSGGLGGFASGELAVIPGQTLNIYVGGVGTDRDFIPFVSAPGGFNGGGDGGFDGSGQAQIGGGGGGASDIRVNGTSLSDRVIVAGGGGGGGGGFLGPAVGGAGGGLIGTDGQTFINGVGGTGGSQIGGGLASTLAFNATHGSVGIGGNGGTSANAWGSGGGGGGYFGGGGGTATQPHGAGHAGGGGGGSSYIGGVTSGVTITGVNTGHGQVIITYFCLTAASINTQPINTATCDNASASFSISAIDATAYQWQVNDGMGWTDVAGPVYTGATDSILSITGATLAMNGYQYRAIAIGCTGNDTSSVVTLTVNPNPSATASTIANATCNGYPNGSAQVVASGGTAPYTYAWSPSGGTGTTAIGLTAGTYTVIVTDFNGCKDTAQTAISHPSPFNVTSSQTNVSCNGGNDGTATVNVSGSTAPYTYAWSNGNTTATATNLSAGSVFVVITDFNGCQTSQNFTITQPPVLTVTLNTQNDVSCNGANDGSISVSVSGGTPAYSYSWTPNVGSSASVSNLAPGAYKVVVTDLKGCKDSLSTTVTQPGSLSLSDGGTFAVACFGDSTGSATVNVSGGTAPFTYLWDDYDAQTTQTATALPAGSYNVTVTDFNGCSDNLAFVITAPATPVSLTALSSTGNPCPGGAVGTASVNPATGGTPGYTYDWTPGNPTGDGTTAITNLAASTYTATVTDNNGCTASQSFIITDNDTVPPTVITQNFTAYLSSLGSVSVSAGQVDNGSNDACGINNITLLPNFFTCANLGDNIVTLEVTDNNGNISTANAIITVVDDENPLLIAPNDTTFNTTSGLCGYQFYNPGFTNDFHPSNWTLVNTNGGTGSVNADTSSVLLIGSDNGSNQQSFTHYQIIMPSDGILTFDWDYTTFDTDGPSFDPFGYTVNGVFIQLTNDGGANNQSGTLSLNLQAGDLFAFTISTDDNVFGAAVSIQSNFNTLLLPSALGSGIASDNCSVTVSNNAPIIFPVGNTTVTWTAIDPSGNTATDTQIVTVVDNTLPVAVAQDITIQLDNAGNASITAAQVDNGSSDACGIDSMTVSPNTFTCANVGNNIVTLSVVDNNGNVSTVNAIVTVEDLVPPVVITQNVNVYLDAAGNGSTTAALVNNGSNDACGIATLDLSQTNFTCAHVGANTVTLIVTDVNGNVDSAFATVTVIDTIAPVVVTQNITVYLDNTGNVSITAAMVNNGSSDACGINTLGVTPNTFTCADIGANNVTLTVTDVNGNVSSDIATVTVADTTLPVITCPADISVGNDAGLCSASGLVLGTPITSDACGIDVLTLSNNAPLNFPVGNTNVVWTVSDVNGNTNTCTQVVMVNDVEIPSITCQNDTVLCGSQVVNYALPDFDDNCSLPSGSTPLLLTQSNSNVVELGNSVACNSGGLHTDNSYWRVYDLAPLSLTDDYTINQITFGIEQAIGNGGAQPITLNVYTLSGPFALANLTQVASETINLADQIQTLVTTPLSTPPTVPSNSTVVLELFSPNGQIDGNSFFIGSNSFGQTAPSYINAAACGLPSPTDLASIGFANMHIILGMDGTVGNSVLTQTTGLPSGSVFPIGTTTNTFVVTDAAGNTNTCSFDVIINPIPVAFAADQELCHNAMTSAINFGSVDTVYNWVNNDPSIGLAAIGTGDIAAFAATNTGMAAVMATITVTPEYTNAGVTCTGNPFDFTITVNPNPSTVTSHTDATCFGFNDGTATVIASGGTPAYNYSWSSGGSSDIETGLAAGTYYVTVTDSKGCSALDSVEILQPVVLSNIPSQVNVSCFAGNDGSATATVSGGTTPYTYLWSPGGQTGATATGLTAGNYTVTVTDSNGCVLVENYTITQPSLISLLPTSNNVSCNGGADGNATVVASGGTPSVITGYTYSWSPSGGNAATASGLAAGTYTVTVTDSLGCISTQLFIITQPTPLTSIMSFTQPLCNGNSNGSTQVTPNGGTPPYAYLWNNGETSQSITGISAGTYSVEITDAKGCKLYDTVIVTQPNVLIASDNGQTNVSCFGGNDGTATVSATGGTGSYTYNWAPFGGNAITGVGLSAGNYIVTVTDSNGCTATQSFTITEPTLLEASHNGQTNVSCFGGANGSATVAVTGGTPSVTGYSYNWAPFGGTAATANGLSVGTYTVTVTDSLGCTDTLSFFITEPTQLALTDNGQTNVSCFGGSDGNATVGVSGGTAPYSYSWSPFGGTGSTGLNLSAGTYMVTVTDFNGCMDSLAFTITEPDLLEALDGGQTNLLCFGDANGEATVSQTGGTAPYTYLWSDGQTTQTATGLVAGTYLATVTDFNGCTDTLSFTITEPAQLLAGMVMAPVTCFGANNGSAGSLPTGGVAPYTYLWSNGSTDPAITNLFAGPYSVTVTDNNGCTVTDTIVVTQPPQFILTGNSTNVSCFGGNDGAASISVAGATPPYSYLWSPNGETTSSITGLSAGMYTVTVTDTNGCSVQQIYTITEPDQLVLTPSQTDVSCNGGSNGTASVSVMGGVAPYVYLWSTGATGNAISGLAAGTYNVEVTDINGCKASVSITINEPTQVVADLGSVTHVSCNGLADGSLTVDPSGGTPGYTYLWSTGATTQTILGLVAGSYDVTVFDSFGCTGVNTFVVTEPTMLTLSMAQTNMDCAGDTNGEGIATPAGGTPPYTYLWSNGQTTATATGLSAGWYTVAVIDDNGCKVSDSLLINEYPVYAGGFEVAAICNGDTYIFGGNPYTTTGLFPHTFTTVNGCDSTVTLDLTVNPVYAGGTQVNTICQGEVFMFGGTGYSTAGIYPHTFSTINGCDSTVTLYLFVNPGSYPVYNVTACDSYTFNGNTYTTSGTHVFNYTNMYGCDSIETLNLTINYSYTNTQNSAICQGDTITFGNTIYTMAGSYVHTFQSVGGCDSVVTMNLVVNPVYTGGTQNNTICQGDSVVFGGIAYYNAGSFTHTFSSISGCDSTVTLNLTVNPTYAGGVQIENICNGQSFTFGGTAYNATGMYPHTFTTVNGCDSTVTLDLTVHPVYAGGIQQTTICQGSTYNFNGTLYSTAGFYTQTFQTINGCDSTVTLHLTVNPLSVTSFTVTACDSYTFNGVPYNTSGTYTQVYSNVFNCDSTVTLNLTIHPSYAGGVQNESICAGSWFVFGGNVYTTAGSYTHTFNAVNGCDSTVTLNLTVNPTYSGLTQNNAICNGDFIVFGGVTYTTTGIYPHTFQSVNGCDSVVTLNLTVNPVYAGGVQVENICSGQSFTFGGTAYSVTGMYTHTFQSVHGCDSTVTLDLTVYPVYVGGIQNSTICQGTSISFGGTVYTTSGIYTHTFTTVHGCDSTVTMNLTVNPNTVNTFTVNACDNYTFNGNLYVTSGVYTQQYTNVYGCDSTVILNLTISPSYNGGVQNNTICQGSFFTFGGTAYNTTGSYTHTFQSVNGCDSTVTLNLTVNPSYSGGVQTVVLCQGQTITFGGTVYSSTGVHTHTFSTVNGCDSTVTLALTVNPTYTGGVQNETICQGGSVLFGGTVYTATGSYPHTFQTQNGCDSTVTLNLIVNPTYVGTQNSTICQGSNIVFGGTSYNAAGSYTHVFQTVNGCDSTVTMNLSLLPTSATNLTAASCVSYTLNNQTYNASGVYTQLFTNANGCDSVVTLNLTIYQPTTHTITASSCASYTINGQTYTQSGTYNQSFINNNGCDSTLVLVLTINHVNVGVTQSGNVLTANLPNAVSYQWINCETGIPIVGDTLQSLTVKVNGTYAVIINDGTCTATSNCISVNNVGINDINIVDANVFPNPNEGDFTIQLGATFPEINVELYDMRGKLIMRRQFYHTDVMYISEVLASGVYQVRVNAGDQHWVKTIIRK